ncbi:CFAP52 isoform 5 [Pan troglodytes]|uniref:Cilia and flagella associated protein 52 n=3 Tax=Hominidae TaxID=9604 RepID=I3L2G9_HUMAN|nr:CFAP52 isoform 3 [Pan troglodytes]PNI58699.1 CFAP52 isoform 5 [Pan troglodytes]PNJ31742.1 CFAP52 isoform 7 [Pongo abelii]PNJ31743.1 CFAP52 isoform 9 [Pongo abelii]
MDNKISPEAQVAELELDAVIGFNGRHHFVGL